MCGEEGARGKGEWEGVGGWGGDVSGMGGCGGREDGGRGRWEAGGGRRGSEGRTVIKLHFEI